MTKLSQPKLSQEGQQGNGDQDAGEEGRICAETANDPADRPSDCAKDSQINGGEKPLKPHAVILAGDLR